VILPEPLDNAAKLPWESDFRVTPADTECPGVSIVIPIYNAGNFLERTIRSLLCNDLTGVEIIVMDGGSTDNTPAILERYSEFFSFCVSAPDSGQSDAINRGFQKATQPILHWLNGDDLLLPDVLCAVRKRFSEADRPEIVVGDAYMTELNLKPINHFQFSKEKLQFEFLIDYAANHLIQPSVFFTRHAWDLCGPVRENLHYAMDADLFLAMSAKFEMVHLPLDVAYSVYHEDCKTRGKRAESITELALVQARHGGLDQSARTLDFLVEMFNDLSKSSEKSQKTDEGLERSCPHCKIRKQKVDALDQRLKRKMQLLLDADLRSA
jgi:glycosyltransferase involved in cell wall biosynthesis